MSQKVVTCLQIKFMKMFYHLLVLGLCIIILQSCSKDIVKPTPPAPSANAISVVVAPNQVYQMNLTGSNTVYITKQASHYQTSETIANAETGSVLYKYIPELNFSGKDQVILSKTIFPASSCSNSGCSQSGCPHNDNPGSENTAATSYTTYTTINITVTN
jgi:hypothetical protein